PRRAADAGNAWKARRALRAQRVHPGRHLERRLVRSVGSRAGEGAGPTDHSGARERERAHARPRQLDEQHDPSLQEAEDYEMTTVGFDQPLYLHDKSRSRFMFELLVPRGKGPTRTARWGHEGLRS